jgi:proline dehydrogenase
MKMVQKAVSHVLPFVPKPIVGYFAKNYIAGEIIEDAVHVVKDLMDEGACATIDVLGEEVKEKDHALKVAETYQKVIHTIESEKLDSNVSVKLTHMGLKIDKEFCYDNVRKLVAEAKKYDNFITIDMEDHTCTSDTLEIFKRLRVEFENVGTVLQTYMRRTLQDMNGLLPLNPNLRICKGIYNEPRDIAYKDEDIINQNFTYVIEKLLGNGSYVGIATHDEKLVWEAFRLIDKYQLRKDQYEFQMLLGVDPELRRIILNEGHRLRVYVPFGREWFAYSTRRLKENPNIAGYIMKSSIKRFFGRETRNHNPSK